MASDELAGTQRAAILLMSLGEQDAANVLKQLSAREVQKLGIAMAELKEVSREQMSSVLDKFIGIADGKANIAGGSQEYVRRVLTQAVGKQKNAMERDKPSEEMGKIEKADGEMHQQIKDLLFVFDNLLDVDDRGIQALLREVGSDTLAVALRGAEPEVQEKVLKNMSKRAAEILKDDMEARGPVKLTDVEAAQKEIIVIAQRMAEEGTISLGGKGAGEFV